MDRELTPKQQTSEAIRQADSILVITGQRPSVDQVASTLALGAVLRKFGKKVTTVISDEIPAGARFLPQPYLENNLDGLRDFIIRVGLNKGEVDKLRYAVEDNSLNVYISPFAGRFAAEDVSFDYGDFHYDLIISLGVASYARLDKVFAQNQSVLQHIPIVNIDFHRSNEQYGAINLVDGTAAGLGEILVALSESLQTGLIDPEIATIILTGIMASTDRFTATHTTSKALTVAAQMMAGGADQQVVVRGLYRSDKGADRQRSAQQAPRQQQSRKQPIEPTPTAQVQPQSAPIAPQPQPIVQAQPAPVVTPEPAPVVESTPEPELAPAPAPIQTEPVIPEEPVAPEAPVILATPEPVSEPTPDPVPVPTPARQTPVPTPEIDVEAPAVTDPDTMPTSIAPAVQELTQITEPVMASTQPEPLINGDEEPKLKQPVSPAAGAGITEPHQTSQNPTNNPVFANRLPW